MEESLDLDLESVEEKCQHEDEFQEAELLFGEWIRRQDI